MKTILAAWSGGLDSTFMVWDALNKGHKVDTIYLDIVNNSRHKEHLAINHIKYQLQLSFCHYQHLGHNEVNLKVVNNQHIALNQAALFLTNLLFVVGKNQYDEVHIGYVMNDDALSFIPELINIWNSFEGILHNDTKLPKLCFPIVKYKKITMWQMLPEEYKQYVVWCEYNLDENCGLCGSCRRMIDAEIMEPVVSNDNSLDNDQLLKEVENG